MSRSGRVWFVAMSVGMAILLAKSEVAGEGRRPVALTQSRDGNSLFVANWKRGTVSIVDLPKQEVVKEIQVGGNPIDLVMWDEGELLVLDQTGNSLVQLTGTGASWKVASRVPVAADPQRLMVNPKTDRCYITSRWSRTLTLVDLSGGGETSTRMPFVETTVALSFEPRELCLVPERNQVVVAGAFDEILTVFEGGDLEALVERKFPGHNIGGLVVGQDGERIWWTRQELNPLGRATRDDVHWGNMITNQLVSLSLNDLLLPPQTHLQPEIHFLGEPGDGASDPGAIDIGPEGEIAVVLAGVGEVALGSIRDSLQLERVPVGQRPIALLRTKEDRLVVANSFSDSLSLLSRQEPGRVDDLSLGARTDLSPTERGEHLFFDGHLSLDGWMSCHSCHTEGHGAGQLNDNLSDGSFGAPKRVLALGGVADTGPWGWNGKVESLAEQVRNSVEKTMQGETPSEEDVLALVAFLEELPLPPPLEARGGGEASADRGKDLFHSLRCDDCHQAPAFTSDRDYDVGMVDGVGNRRFNPPSLLRVGRNISYFHDGKTESLEDALAIHLHHFDHALSLQELDDLAAYVRSL